MIKNKQYYQFCTYGFLKNLRFFDAFFILLLIDKGISFTSIGILYASREIIINILEIPSGIIADTYGRKTALVLSFIFYIFAFMIFYLSNQFWYLMLGFILFGFGDAFRSGTHKAMIMDYLQLNNLSSQKTLYYGHTRACSQKGTALSALFAGLIIFLGSNSIFLFTIIPYLFNIINIISYPKFLNRPNKISNKQNSIKTTFKSFINTLKNRNLLALLNTSATHSAYVKAIKDYIQIVILQIGISIPFFLDMDMNKRNGLFIGITYFTIYLISSYASKSSSKILSLNIIPKHKIAFISLIIGFGFGAISGLMYQYEFYIISLVLFTGIYIIENIRKPILTGFISDNAPNEILASVLSAQSQIKTFLTAIFAISFGFLMDNYGIGLSLLTISIIMILITTILKITNDDKN